MDIVVPGQITDSSCLIIRGLAGRFEQMRNGRRQATALHIAGDMCDLHSVMHPKASSSITALTDVAVVFVPHAALYQAAYENPEIAVAFWHDSIADASILAKWVGNLGRKDATARLAHLFCEMGVRMGQACLGEPCHYQLGITQVQLADAVGLTSVHVNRGAAITAAAKHPSLPPRHCTNR